MPRGEGARGFTLVELIVAMVLVAIFAALAVPSLSSTMKRAEARKTARELANTFRQARNQAMSRGEVVVAEAVTASGNSDKADSESDRGHVALLRSNNNVTNCSSIQGYTEVGEPTIVENVSSGMQLRGMTGGGSSQLICFTPDGRALDESGGVITADESNNCGLENFRMWIADQNADSQEVTDAAACDSDASTRTMINFWVVEVSYNGAIKAEK